MVQVQGLRSLSHHVGLNGHGLDAVRRRRTVRAYDGLSEKSSPGPDDVVDGELKGAQPGLGRLFKYLRGEMLEKLMTSDVGLEAGAKRDYSPLHSRCELEALENPCGYASH